jgi:hypothetical protein
MMRDCAAPHLPTGILSPYSDGEKKAGRNVDTPPLPVLHGGPKDGRDPWLALEWVRVRGSTDLIDQIPPASKNPQLRGLRFSGS